MQRNVEWFDFDVSIYGKGLGKGSKDFISTNGARTHSLHPPSSFSPSLFTAMSVVANGTIPLSDVWSGYLAHAQAQLGGLNPRLVLLLLVNVPVLAIVLNVLRQLVRLLPLGICVLLLTLLCSFCHARLTSRLSFFIGYQSLVRLLVTVLTHSTFSPSVARRYVPYFLDDFKQVF